MLEDLQTILLKKWKQNKLAHFYIVRPTGNVIKTRDFFNQWVDSFMIKIIMEEHMRASHENLSYQRAKEKYQNGHPDILILELREDKKQYTLEDFQVFFKYLHYKNIEYKQRFVIIKDVNFLTSNTLSNKLLKSLEEPTPNTVIIFINPTFSTFIPTIESRAISLRLQGDHNNKIRNETFIDEFASLNFERWMTKTITEKTRKLQDEEDKKNLTILKEKILLISQKKIPIYEFVNYLKSSLKLQNLFIELVTRWVAYDNSFKAKDLLLIQTKWHMESARYHNPFHERLLSFALQLQNSVNKLPQ